MEAASTSGRFDRRNAEIFSFNEHEERYEFDDLPSRTTGELVSYQLFSTAKAGLDRASTLTPGKNDGMDVDADVSDDREDGGEDDAVAEGDSTDSTPSAGSKELSPLGEEDTWEILPLQDVWEKVGASYGDQNKSYFQGDGKELAQKKFRIM